MSGNSTASPSSAPPKTPAAVRFRSVWDSSWKASRVKSNGFMTATLTMRCIACCVQNIKTNCRRARLKSRVSQRKKARVFSVELNPFDTAFRVNLMTDHLNFQPDQLAVFLSPGGEFALQCLNLRLVGPQPFLHRHLQFIHSMNQSDDFRGGRLLRQEQITPLPG